MHDDELDNDNDHLLDDDATLDFLLYEKMIQEDDKSRPQAGCLGVVVVFVVPPAVWLACRWL